MIHHSENQVLGSRIWRYRYSGELSFCTPWVHFETAKLLCMKTLLLLPAFLTLEAHTCYNLTFRFVDSALGIGERQGGRGREIRSLGLLLKMLGKTR